MRGGRVSRSLEVVGTAVLTLTCTAIAALAVVTAACAAWGRGDKTWAGDDE
jgi:hypothetical protein